MRIHLQNVPAVSSIPLVQICGSIVCFNDQLRRPRQIKVTTSASDGSKCSPAIWPIVNGQFKVFAHLKRSVNCFKLWIEDENETEDTVIDHMEVTVRYKAPANANNANKRVVRLIYLTCKDETNEEVLFENGHFEADEKEDSSPESACRRISTGALMSQTFFAHTLAKTGDNHHRTFQLEVDSNGLPIVHCFTLQQTQSELWSMKPEDLWKLTAVQLMSSSLGNVHHFKYLAFASFSRYKGISKESGTDWWLPSAQVKGHVSLGGGGLALLSTHCLYCWPERVDDIGSRLIDHRPIDRTRFMDDSNNRNSRSGCFASTLGAKIHELAHTFNLGHSDVGIMERAFHQIDKFFLPESDHFSSQWWTLSEMTILRRHHWLNVSAQIPAQFTYDETALTILSSHSILVTEYRSLIGNSVLKSDVFSRPVNSIKVETKFCDSKTTTVLLFLMDITGNILLQPITV